MLVDVSKFIKITIHRSIFGKAYDTIFEKILDNKKNSNKIKKGENKNKKN